MYNYFDVLRETSNFLSKIDMLHFFETSHVPQIFDHGCKRLKKLPVLQRAPTKKALTKCASKEMPALMPAPRIAKRKYSQAFEQNFIPAAVTLDDSLIPDKEIMTNEIDRYTNFTQNVESKEILIQKTLEVFDTHKTKDEKNVIKRPRTKTTYEEFFKISNMGFSVNSAITVMKCFSTWCNYKSKVREQFLDHLTQHHQNDNQLNSFDVCKLCNRQNQSKSLRDEFYHMVDFHIDKNEASCEAIKKFWETSCVKNIAQSQHTQSDIEISIENESQNSCDSGRLVVCEDDIDAKLEILFNEESGEDQPDSDNKLLSMPILDFDCREQPVPVKKSPVKILSVETLQSVAKNKSDKTLKAQNKNRTKRTKADSSKLSVAKERKKMKYSEAKFSQGSNAKIYEYKIHKIQRSASLNDKPIEVIKLQRVYKRPLSMQRSLESLKSDKPLLPKSTNSNCNSERFKKINELIREEKSVTYRGPSTTESSPSISPLYSANSSPKLSPSQSISLEIQKFPHILKSFTKPRPEKILTNSLKIAKNSVLMKWVKEKHLRSNMKYDLVYQKMMEKYKLFALFKCMGAKCSFTTNRASTMTNHLLLHAEENKDSKDYFLCCPYCRYTGKNCLDIVSHVRDIHRKDIYQCAYCFFRSCEKETCAEHLKKFHKDCAMKIYECPGDEHRKDVLQMNLFSCRYHNKREQNVKPFRCKICDLYWYPLEPFLNHLEFDHTSEKESLQVQKDIQLLEQAFDANGYGLIECLFCIYGCESEESMSVHFLEHPSEFRYYCKRSPPPGDDKKFFDPLTIEATTIQRLSVMGEDIETIPFYEKPELLEQSFYKELVDKDLQPLLVDSSSPSASDMSESEK